MGKLLALELFNFKSYKGHHTLLFGDSYFTSIIGPNGSGKSNSMDAISFVLGIKSSHLRSTHLRDLVYRGRVLKHSKINADGTATDGVANGVDAQGGAAEDGDEDDAPTQDTQRDDPQTAWVMAVYEDDAGEEQRWKRTITSSGASEYRINNRAVNAKAYNEALEAENILIKARNFLVFQGDVEAIASQSPKDLTKLIEQISGSLEYKADYERLKVEKEKADEDQTYNLLQRRGINGEIKQYQQQKDEADSFRTKQDEKDAAIVEHILWKLFHFQRTIEESTDEIKKHQEELKEFRRNVQKYEDRLEEAKREQAKASRDVNVTERIIKGKEKMLEEKDNQLVPVDEKLSISKRNLKKYDSRISDVAGERDGQAKTVDQLQKNLRTVQKAQKKWEDEWNVAQQSTGRELNEQDMQEYQGLRGEVYKQSGQDQIKVDNIARQLRTDEETVNSLQSKVESFDARVAKLNDETADLQARRSERNKNVQATTSEIGAKKKQHAALESERSRNAQKHRELDEKLQEVLIKLYDASAARQESEKEMRQKETVAAMKRIFPGVRGMVHQLCKPKQKKYEIAVATMLGRHWDAVVVDTEKTAKECIGYLKEQRAGQATFIPLDTIIHNSANASMRGMHRGMRLAIDTIEFEASVERAMSYACGNAIVTDDLAIARHLCFEKHVEAKAVALNGTVISKGGLMTGGQGPNDRARKFEESEVDNLRLLREKFETDMAALPKGHQRQREEEQLLSEIEGLQQNLKFGSDEVAALERNINDRQKEVQHATEQLADARPKYDEQAQGLETLRESLEQIISAIAEIEDTVFARFCQRLAYESIRDYEKQQGSMQQEAAQKKLEFTTQRSRLENQLTFETQRLQSTETRIKTLEESSKRDRDLITQLEEEKGAIGSDMDTLNAEIEDLNEQLAELQRTFKAKADLVNEARREVQKRSKSVEKTVKEVVGLQAEVQRAATGRYGLLRKCKVENIELPLEDNSRGLERLPLEDAIQEEDEDAMDIDSSPQAPKVNDYGIRISFHELDEDLQDDSSDEYGARLEDKLSTLQAELDKMAPNMRSYDRLSATSEKLKSIERDFAASRSGAKKASRAFEAVQQQRMDSFNKAFAHIAEQISPIYRELTKSATFPLGGQAYLDSEDSDEPYVAGIKYHAMPPLKRFRDMEHLSGGEKTMAALALLFAIHTFAPSPFFVLDEVDAALDHANTSRLAAYVREKAGPGMQFVVISLKTGLFQNSETLVGVMRDQAVNSSRALTLDLRKYQAV